MLVSHDCNFQSLAQGNVTTAPIVWHFTGSYVTSLVENPSSYRAIFWDSRRDAKFLWLLLRKPRNHTFWNLGKNLIVYPRGTALNAIICMSAQWGRWAEEHVHCNRKIHIWMLTFVSWRSWLDVMITCNGQHDRYGMTGLLHTTSSWPDASTVDACRGSKPSTAIISLGQLAQ